jgi:anti-sigma-K factor RskA
MTSDLEPEDWGLLAAEYALGLLTGKELDVARALAARDAEFASLVTDWEVRLAVLAEDLAPERPGVAVKQALMADLFGAPERLPFWQRLWLWQAIGAVSVALLAIVVLIGPMDRARGPAGPLYVGEIVADAGDFRVVAVVDTATDEVFLTRTAGAVPEGRILQVWAHGEGAPAISVGLWPEGDTIRLPMPATIAAVEGVLTVGVSEEPPGGSPTGSPSGRVFGTVDIAGVINTN